MKKLGENRKNDFTTEQLLDVNLKNVGGETNLEVRKRMCEFFEEVVDKYNGRSVAAVSHGAAIKFFLQHFCDYDFESNSFFFNNKIICSAKLESPSVLKFVFVGSVLKAIKIVKIGS